MNPSDYSLFRYTRARTGKRLSLAFSITIRPMFRRTRPISGALWFSLLIGLFGLSAAQQPPPPSAARILLLPRRIVSGERATLAVLDVSGRLTPGVSVNFSNGDHLVTDATGRARFVAPLAAGVIYASIGDRSGRVYTTILRPAEATAPSLSVDAAPQFASVADRFEISGRNFCGDADANQVQVADQPALVLAASPTNLIILPPENLPSGPASLTVACSKRMSSPFSTTFLELSLEADPSPLKSGENRTLIVRVRGTTAKVPLEARNLAPEIAELAGGNPARASSSGGPENVGQFQVTGRQGGNFLISIRLVPTQAPPIP
jgi:hypothetical protein